MDPDLRSKNLTDLGGSGSGSLAIIQFIQRKKLIQN
jgi:hypothetical protein